MNFIKEDIFSIYVCAIAFSSIDRMTIIETMNFIISTNIPINSLNILTYIFC